MYFLQSQNYMIGKKAPAFAGIDQDGNKIALKDYRGQKVALYFYPRNNTPGCTAQACNLRDNMSELKTLGIQVIGVSSDDIASHKKFHTKHALNFPLIADNELKIHEQYGTWQEKKFMGKTFMGTVRTTFLIDEQQKIQHIITKPKTNDHVAEIKKTWQLS